MRVPFRRISEIDAMVLDLLQKYCAMRGRILSPPIDIDDIIEGYLGIDLQFADLKESLGIPDVLGATWLEDKVMRIDSSLEGKDGRAAFTMAHEVGHWWMHRPIYEMDKVSLQMFAYDGQKDPRPAIVCRSAQKKAPAEYQADQFAATLLMPASLLRAAVASIQGSGPILVEKLDLSLRNVAENGMLRTVAKTIIDSHGFSNVSVDAMCYRLNDLKYVSDADPKQPQLFS